MIKYWERVLIHFDKNRYYQNGLTIPFLMGSCEIVEPNFKIQTVNEFMKDVTESEPFVTLQICTQLNEYVIGVLDAESNNFRNQYPGMYKEFGNLSFIDYPSDSKKNFNDISIELDIKYSNKVMHKTFSKMYSGKWEYYNQQEVDRLKEVVNL